MAMVTLHASMTDSISKDSNQRAHQLFLDSFGAFKNPSRSPKFDRSIVYMPAKSRPVRHLGELFHKIQNIKEIVHNIINHKLGNKFTTTIPSTTYFSTETSSISSMSTPSSTSTGLTSTMSSTSTSPSN